MKFVMYAVASIAIVYFAGVAAGMMAISDGLRGDASREGDRG